MNIRKTVKKVIPHGAFKAVEPYGHLAEAMLLTVKNGFPAKGLKVIGVTGTNGKTTTAFMIYKMLYEAGYNVGLMTTVAYGVGDDIKPQIAHMTTVSVPLLHKRLKSMKAAGAEWIVLETTSHALAQHRVWGVPYSIAVMTNITHEHLDYHGTFENYRNAKLAMFTMTNRNKKGLRMGIVNADDETAQLFADATQNTTTYGIDNGDMRASNVVLAPSGVSYTATIANDTYDITTKIPGKFNVYNSLAAVGVGRVLGLTKEQIEKGIAALEGVEGRMTRINEGQDFDVIVDFAHTPDSFEKLFKDIQPVVKGRLIVLFGSAGRRDEAKRAIQGRLAGEYADVVIVTEEDDRDIDGIAIMNEIAAGAEEKGKVRDNNLFTILDRTEAIEYAVSIAQPNDTLLFLGKGHEKTIERADGEHPWDEISTTRSALKNRTTK